MKEFASQLRSILTAVEPRLSRMAHDEVSIKPNPKEWSKKEILGHLIDSVANNHQRFVRAVYNDAARFPPYEQEKWVDIQRHHERPWASLVSLWWSYNDHLSHVIECIPKESESSPCNIGREEPLPLALVIEDYLRHLQHHLDDILDNKEVRI